LLIEGFTFYSFRFFRATTLIIFTMTSFNFLMMAGTIPAITGPNYFRVFNTIFIGIGIYTFFAHIL